MVDYKKKDLARRNIEAIFHDISIFSALGECMSADSCYSGLALSIGIRSKALTVKDLRQFKVLHKNCPEIWITEEKKLLTLFSTLGE